MFGLKFLKMKVNISHLICKMARSKISKDLMLNYAEKSLHNTIFSNNTEELEAIKEKKYIWGKALLHGVIKNLGKWYIDSKILEKLSNTLVKGAFQEDKKAFHKIKETYKKKNGVYPPSFLVISPSQRCNLKCKGCYASSDKNSCPSLSFKLVKGLIKEFHDEGGGRFIVISGGEPLMYRSEGKDILDLAALFPDTFFMFFTNGTLIDEEKAKKLYNLANIIPCISVEGYEKETDFRRGTGVYKKIHTAMKNLRNVGLPFGMSVTSTSQNTNLLLDDAFYDYYFEEQGCSFMWQFQLMPIGRGKDNFNLMPKPEQRVDLYRKWEYLIDKKKYCIADFWNSAVLCKGCVAYGRTGGYIYVDWNGNVMPCVFVPYVADNIIKASEENRNLASILKSPLLVNGREWHEEYILKNYKKPGNMLMPCSIRDHYENFCKNILTKQNKGEDQIADEIIKDKEYYKNMKEYDVALEKLTEPIWSHEFLKES